MHFFEFNYLTSSNVRAHRVPLFWMKRCCF